MKCENANAEFIWSLNRVPFSVDTILGPISIPGFGMDAGFRAICLKVAPTGSSNFPEKSECRYFDVKIPDLVVILKGDDNDALYGQAVTLDASLSFDPLDAPNVPTSLRPQKLVFTWTCAVESSLPSLNDSERGNFSAASFCTSDKPETIQSCQDIDICVIETGSLGLVANVWYSFKV